MEAKDTVMTWKQKVECSHNPNFELRARDICLAQAEISFKAGIREVVEWVENHSGVMSFINMHHEEEWNEMVANIK